MPEIATPYAPGSLCGVYLAPQDQQATLDFYRDLLGWKGDPADQVVCELNGKAVALVGSKEYVSKIGLMVPLGMWIPLFACTDAWATLGLIQKAGGRQVGTVREVGKLGKMLVAVDHQGAHFGLWEPGEFAGAQVTHETGAVNWIELRATNMDAAMPFYQAVFGFQYASNGGGTYKIGVGDQEIGGLCPGDPGRPARWMTYFQVDDVDSSKDTLAQLGGASGGHQYRVSNGSQSRGWVGCDTGRAEFVVNAPTKP